MPKSPAPTISTSTCCVCGPPLRASGAGSDRFPCTAACGRADGCISPRLVWSFSMYAIQNGRRSRSYQSRPISRVLAGVAVRSLPHFSSRVLPVNPSVQPCILGDGPCPAEHGGWCCRRVQHLPVGMKSREVQRHVPTQPLHHPVGECLDLSGRIVQAGDQQRRDLKSDVRRTWPTMGQRGFATSGMRCTSRTPRPTP